jgi:hypothetical protein
MQDEETTTTKRVLVLRTEITIIFSLSLQYLKRFVVNNADILATAEGS